MKTLSGHLTTTVAGRGGDGLVRRGAMAKRGGGTAERGAKAAALRYETRLKPAENVVTVAFIHPTPI